MVEMDPNTKLDRAPTRSVSFQDSWEARQGIHRKAEEQQRKISDLAKELSGDPAKFERYRSDAARLLSGVYLNTGVSGKDVEERLTQMQAQTDPHIVAANFYTAQELHDQQEIKFRGLQAK